MNTICTEYAERGMLFVEGGWPKDVNPDDPEQTARYRKKAEKDEIYLQSVVRMSVVSAIIYFQITHNSLTFFYSAEIITYYICSVSVDYI